MPTVTHARTKADPGNGSFGIFRVSDASRSPSPDPRRSSNRMTRLFSPLCLLALTSFILAAPEAGVGKAAGSQETAVAEATKDLTSVGIDPARKKLTVSKVFSGKTYFETRPKSDYWNQGRKAVGKVSFYLVTFREPKIAPGGTHQYFFDATTHKLLWITRSR
jgi:hypothetical protein